MRIKTTDNNKTIFDNECLYIMAFIDHDQEQSSGIEYGQANKLRQASTILKMLMTIQDKLDEDPLLRGLIDKAMAEEYDTVRKIWKEMQG